jgi:hypothetical protein
MKRISREEYKWKLPDLKYLSSGHEFLVWVSDDQWGDWLPFQDQDELDCAMVFLEKKMNFNCYRFSYEDHKYEKRPYIYVPVDVDPILKEAYSQHQEELNTIGLKYKIGMSYLDEK